jgi:hypothetical protein
MVSDGVGVLGWGFLLLLWGVGVLFCFVLFVEGSGQWISLVDLACDDDGLGAKD